MVSLALAFALAGLGSASAQTPPGAMRDGTKAQIETPTQSPVVLSPEARGDIFMARKMYREAIEAFAEGSKKDPVLLNKAGIAYHQMQQLDRARSLYGQALKLKPTYAEAQNNIGAIYYAQKSFRRAVGAYQKALKLSPDSASIHMNLGTAYFARKMEKESIAEYKIALQLDPGVFEHHGTYGVLLEERSVEEKAKYHYALAKLYATSGRADLALQYLRKALEEGFRDRKKLTQDPEFQAMRELPEFQELLTMEPHVL
jgi:tetratricopeptide (TPR) repeat protein